MCQPPPFARAQLGLWRGRAGGWGGWGWGGGGRGWRGWGWRGGMAGMGSAPAGYRPPQRARVRPDRLYLGWQYAPLHADPGPLPRRPAPPAAEQLSQGWVDAQQREERRLSRPLKVACAASLAASGLVLGLGLTGLLNVSLTVAGMVAGLAGAAVSGRGVRRGAQELRGQIPAGHRRGGRQRRARPTTPRR